MIPDNSHHPPSAWVTLFVVSTVQFLTPFLASAVSVALPAIGQEFEVGALQLSLIQLIYILAASSFLLPIGRCADIWGRKKIFIIGILLITLSSLLVTFAHSIQSFIIYRFIQGFGAAMITSTSVAILSSVFPKESRGKAMGIIVAFVYIGLAAGPTIAGFLITHFSWRWIFWGVIPLEIAALFLTLLKLKGEWFGAKGEPFDWIGTIFYVFSLCFLVLGGSLYNTIPHSHILGITGIITFCLFIWYEKRSNYPLIDISLLQKNINFSLNNLATLINYAASFGIVFLFSLYLQEARHISAQQTGFILICQPVVQACIAPFAGKLSDRYAPSLIATSGMFLCVIGLAFAATIDLETPLWFVMLIFAIMGVGFGLFSSANMVAIMGSVGEKLYGIASSVVATMRSLGTLISMGLITVTISHYLGDNLITPNNSQQFIRVMQICFTIFTLLGILGIIFSYTGERLIKRNKFPKEN